MVRKRCMLTPFSMSNFTKSTLSRTRASNMACSKDPTCKSSHWVSLPQALGMQFLGVHLNTLEWMPLTSGKPSAHPRTCEQDCSQLHFWHSHNLSCVVGSVFANRIQTFLVPKLFPLWLFFSSGSQEDTGSIRISRVFSDQTSCNTSEAPKWLLCCPPFLPEALN